MSDISGLLYQLPYGPGLWRSLELWPNKFSSRLNVITKFVTFDCGSDWWVYVETLLPALGNVVLVLLDFGWDDVARGYFRPAGIRARWKLREGKKKTGKKGKRKKGGFDIPEIGEIIGKRLPYARAVKARRVGNFQRFLWKIDGMAQRVLWYWLVIDLTADFFYNWSTGIMKHERCWKSGAGWLVGGPGYASWSANGNWTSIGAPSPVERGGELAEGGVPIFIPPGRSGYVAVDLGEVDGFLGRVTHVGTRVVSDDVEVLDVSPLVNIDNTDEVAPFSIARVDGGSSGRVIKPQVIAHSDGGDTAITYEATVFAKLL